MKVSMLCDDQWTVTDDCRRLRMTRFHKEMLNRFFFFAVLAQAGL